MPTPESSPEKHQPGVLSHRIENRHYVITIRWQDGQESDMHLPTGGFDVINPDTGQPLGRLTGEEALQVLVDHAGETTRKI